MEYCIARINHYYDREVLSWAGDWHADYDDDSYAEVYDTYAEAQARVDDLNEEDEDYVCSHNEYDPPSYYIVDRGTYGYIRSCNHDASDYDWDEYDGELDDDSGEPADMDEAYEWMRAQDVEFVMRNVITEEAA